MVIYLAATWSPSNPTIDALRARGHTVVLPSSPGGDLPLLARCDALLLPADWKNGTHEAAETAWGYATAQGIPIYVLPDMPVPHPTELRCPEQVSAFMEIVMRMYRVHLAKNSDYSPANILVPGELGLVTRLWDKVARLLNLSGFRFEVVSAGHYEQPKTPNFEAVEDSYMDLAVYGVIGLLLRRGQWGK